MDHPLDPALSHAYRQWLPYLQRGIALLQEETYEAALTPLSEAIRISASYHPLIHFLESGLNTECGLLLRTHGEEDKARDCFDRALFLHHDNETALRAKAGDASPPIYPTLQLSGALVASGNIENGVYAFYDRAGRTEGEARFALLHDAIEACEILHRQYHSLAAEPWTWRARVFRRLGQTALADNDTRRAYDLQPPLR